MAKYAYPAVFTKEAESSCSIRFPDFESCYTCADTIEEGIEMAEDVLALTLYGYETQGKAIPAPSDAALITAAPNEFVRYIRCDTMEYRKS